MPDRDDNQDVRLMDNEPVTPNKETPQLLEGEMLDAQEGVWYKMAVSFVDHNGYSETGCLARPCMPPQSGYDSFILKAGPILYGEKFRLHYPTNKTWPIWELEDGNFLTVTPAGWLYRTSVRALAVGFKIDRYQHFWNAHDNVKMGHDYYGPFSPYVPGEYVGEREKLFTCKLVRLE